MNRLLQFATRWYRARRFGVAFRGMGRTVPPTSLTIAGRTFSPTWPDEPLAAAVFINLVVDDEYGLLRLSPAPQTIVDIGANIGMFSNWARDCFPQAVIHAYEPSAASAAMARHNAAHPLTTIYEEGLAAQAGRAAMVDLGDSVLARTTPSDEGAIALVDFATVLQRIGGRIDLLKVDCEGAEWDFMHDRAAFAAVGCIRMEYHLVDGRTIDDVHALARNLGFRITRLEQNQGFGIAWLDRD